MRACAARTSPIDLPAELIAQAPLAERSASRMLVLAGSRRRSRRPARCASCPRTSRRGDLLVLNDTRVVAARLLGSQALRAAASRSCSSARSPATRRWRSCPPASRIRAGLAVATAGGEVRVLAREQELWRIALPAAGARVLRALGRGAAAALHPTAPPEPGDRERYQSIFAREPGAVAAPTASLHFDAPLLAALAARGVESRASSRCTSAPAPSSRCASTISPRTACTPSGRR